MNLEYTAVIKQDGDWWVGWIQEVPGVNCQEKSYEALRETLAVTLGEALEFNRQDALAAACGSYKEESITLSS
ncbi:MAG: type II toxin-antitoxin system HicB family antitoxin [Candidatus Hydrogenedentes bacterium]|nr:type II toxin-antitoxin system HicB family antitoxin [Candidatus Hydrogenedentota bacterium]